MLPYRVVHTYLEDPISSVVDLNSCVIETLDNLINEVVSRHENYEVSGFGETNINPADDEEDIPPSDVCPDEMALLGLPTGFGGASDLKRARLDEQKIKKKKAKKKKARINESNHRNHIRQKYSQDEKYAFLFPPCPADLGVSDKYWDQRYRLLSKFDQGVKLDPESWYSITPEVIAHHITDRCTALAKKHNVVLRTALDGFCGCGGNAMSLTRAFQHVIAVDLDPLKVSYCQHNAAIYQVSENMKFLNRDIYHVLRSLQRTNKEVATASSSSGFTVVEETSDGLADSNSDDDSPICLSSKPVPPACLIHQLFPLSSSLPPASDCSNEVDPVTCAWCIRNTDKKLSIKYIDMIFLAPPWGGPDYTQADSFDLRTMLPSGDGFSLMRLAASVCDHLVLMIPRNTSRKQLRVLQTHIGLPCIVEEVYLYKKLKMKVVYFGNLFVS